MKHADVALTLAAAGRTAAAETLPFGVQGSPHVAIPVPLRSTVLEPNAVQHAIAEKPMRRIGMLRIRSVSHVQADELGWDRAFDRQIESVDLGGHRREIVLQPPRLARIEWLLRRFRLVATTGATGEKRPRQRQIHCCERRSL